MATPEGTDPREEERTPVLKIHTAMEHGSEHSQQMSAWVLPVSATVLWVSVPFVSLTSKCLLSSESCTRWGPEHGAGFGRPQTTTAFQLIMVGLSIGLYLFIQAALKTGLLYNLRTMGYSLVKKARVCSLVGTVFGVKYVISHWALSLTPTAVFEIFHCINIVFIALFAWVLVGERSSKFEIIACTGIVAGSAIAVAENFSLDQTRSIGVLALVLNLVNAALAGVVVALLRWTTLQMDELNMSVSELTCLKMVTGGVAVLPVAWWVEGSIISMTSTQLLWLWISAGVILIYHLNLSLLTSLAPALAVGVLESLKPVPAFVIVAFVQGLPRKSTLFWVGSCTTLASAAIFRLLRTRPHSEQTFENEPSETSGATSEQEELTRPLLSEETTISLQGRYSGEATNA